VDIETGLTEIPQVVQDVGIHAVPPVVVSEDTETVIPPGFERLIATFDVALQAVPPGLFREEA
jgi:hypothetical protein